MKLTSRDLLQLKRCKRGKRITKTAPYFTSLEDDQTANRERIRQAEISRELETARKWKQEFEAARSELCYTSIDFQRKPWHGDRYTNRNEQSVLSVISRGKSEY